MTNLIKHDTILIMNQDKNIKNPRGAGRKVGYRKPFSTAKKTKQIRVDYDLYLMMKLAKKKLNFDKYIRNIIEKSEIKKTD